jgi:hypothetical protein
MPTPVSKKPDVQTDYVKHGSPQHAAILGIVEDKTNSLGYRLLDATAFGPQATQAYLDEVLRQKVAELKAGEPPYPQSEHPGRPNYAPALWVPTDN